MIIILIFRKLDFSQDSNDTSETNEYFSKKIQLILEKSLHKNQKPYRKLSYQDQATNNENQNH